MNDYISRQAVVNKCGDWYVDEGTESGFIGSVNQMFDMFPAVDVVPVVRCKDCKQFRRWVNTDIEFCDLTESTVFGDDFCSRGERRELAQ